MLGALSKHRLTVAGDHPFGYRKFKAQNAATKIEQNTATVITVGNSALRVVFCVCIDIGTSLGFRMPCKPSVCGAGVLTRDL